MLEQVEKWIDGLALFEKGLIVYFFILFVIWLWTSDEETKEKSNHDSNQKPGHRPSYFLSNKPIRYELTVNKKEFIRDVVRWGMRNLNYTGANQQKKSVNLDISYYMHKKFKGTFNSSNNRIRVYVNNHATIEDIIDTSLHEVVHFLQFCADKKHFQTRYSKLLKGKTYAKHPMEIEAVKIASNYTQDCMNYMIAQGKIKKTA